MRKVITRVLPLPAPARINTGPSTASAASRCCGLSLSRRSTNSAFIAGKLGLAIRALAACAQVIPGINAGLMPIIPVEADGVLTHALHLLGPQLLFVQREQRCCLLDRLSSMAV